MHGEGDEAILDRDWLGFVKAEVAGLLRLGLLLLAFFSLAFLCSSFDSLGFSTDALSTIKPVYGSLESAGTSFSLKKYGLGKKTHSVLDGVSLPFTVLPICISSPKRAK